MHHNPSDPSRPGSQPPSSSPAPDGRGDDDDGEDPFMSALAPRPAANPGGAIPNPALIRSALLDALDRVELSPSLGPFIPALARRRAAAAVPTLPPSATSNNGAPPHSGMDGQGNPNISSIHPPDPSALDRVFYPSNTAEFYVVTCGTCVGIFDQWTDAQDVAFGITNGCATRAPTWEAAVERYTHAYSGGVVKLAEYKAKRKRATSRTPTHPTSVDSASATPQPKKPPFSAPSPAPTWHGAPANPIFIHSTYVTPNKPPPRARKQTTRVIAPTPTPATRTVPPQTAPTTTAGSMPSLPGAACDADETRVIVVVATSDEESEGGAVQTTAGKGKAKAVETKAKRPPVKVTPKVEPLKTRAGVDTKADLPQFKAVPKVEPADLHADVERRPRKFLIVELPHTVDTVAGSSIEHGLRSWVLVENLPPATPQTAISDLAPVLFAATSTASAALPPATPQAAVNNLAPALFAATSVASVAPASNSTARPSNAVAGPSTAPLTTASASATYDSDDGIEFLSPEFEQVLASYDSPVGVVFRNPKA